MSVETELVRPSPVQPGSALVAQHNGEARRAARGGVCLARRQGLSVAVSGGSLGRQSPHTHAPPCLRRRGAALTVPCEGGCRSSTLGGPQEVPRARAGAARAHGAAGCAPHPPCRLLGHFVGLSNTQNGRQLRYRAGVSRMCFSRAPGSPSSQIGTTFLDDSSRYDDTCFTSKER